MIVFVGCVENKHAALVSGVNSSGIVGGEKPDPAVAGFASTVKILKYDRMHCTGTLIGPRLVLTAAHCLLNSVSNDFEILFPAALSETRLVVAQKYHSEFRRATSRDGDIGRNDYKHDIALMLLDEQAPEAAVVAALPKHAFTVDKDVVLRAYGYGRTSMANQGDGVLLTALVNGKIDGDRPDRISIDQAQGGGLCNGDSGGPLFAYENEKALLVGVASGADRWQTKNGVLQGDICRYFGVATQVGSYLDWIARTSIELK